MCFSTCHSRTNCSRNKAAAGRQSWPHTQENLDGVAATDGVAVLHNVLGKALWISLHVGIAVSKQVEPGRHDKDLLACSISFMPSLSSHSID